MTQTIQAPLVTVMLRSMQRSSLMKALDSVASQTDPAIEVLVVNARGGHHPEIGERCGAHALRLVNQDGEPLGRPEAANLAMDQAHGQWLLFLDDDDQIDPDHIARLRCASAQAPEAVAAYAGVRLIDPDGQVVGVLDEAFDSHRLWLANYLPIHAVLFSREAVVSAGIRFDHDLSIYEDWDFWRQLSLVGPFLHLPGVSASYCLVGDSGLSAQASAAVAQDGRARFYRKWLPRLDSDSLNRLATGAELSRSGMAALSDQLKQAERRAIDLHHETTRQLADAEQERHRLAHALQQQITHAEALGQQLQAEQAAHQQAIAAHQEAIDAHEARQADLDRRLGAALSEYRRLEQGYRDVTASLSWRVTAPLRAARHFCTAAGFRSALRGAVRALPIAASTKQAMKVGLSTRGPLGQRLLRWLAPTSVVQPAPTSAAPTAPIDKEAVRAAAEAELTGFLASTRRVHLRQGSGTPRVSVVVVLYNQAGLSLLCLQALAESEGVEFETLIVDNASSDRMPLLLDRITGARILRQDHNLGFLRAVNLAAEQATGEHLLLLNNDAVVEPRTLAQAVARLATEPGVGAVGGPILLWDGRLQEAGSIIWRDGSCLGYGRGDSPDAPAYRFVRDVDYCSGALLLIRRALFEQLGRFDDAFAPAYYEESDFCVRLWEAGHRVVCDPAVRVKHFEFASDVGSGRAIELQTQHRALFVARHPDFLAGRPLPDAASILLARHRLPVGAKRVLVIDDRVPLPWLGQGYPRAASLVAAMVADGHFVTHYPLQFPSERAEDVAKALPETVEVMLDMGLGRLAEFMAARRGCYDVVLVSRPHNMDVVRSLLKQNPGAWVGVRIAYDAEALFSLRDIAKAAVLGAPMSPNEQRRRIAAEMALAEGAHAIVTVTEAEAAHYRAAGHADVQVVGHTIEPRPSPRPFDRRRGFLFVGAMPADDTPNADSLVWFVGQVWPRIVAALGDEAVLDIVGACEAPGVRALASLSVRIHGAVADLEPCFSAARVFIVPTRYAAGIPHKAHEAAARGLPMVVTRLIAQQLGWEKRVPVGDDAVQFAEACVRLHQSAALWRESSDQVLAAVREDCNPAVFARQLRNVLGQSSGKPLPRVDLEPDRRAPAAQPSAAP
ncbi:MAG: glycosyltransferase [Ideonella sp.]|nr:glycosyltransferase [Ideonella sp.]